MEKYKIILCVLIHGASIATAVLNHSEVINENGPYEGEVIKISIFSRKNRTGQLYAQVKLEEGLDKKNAWQVDIDHESEYSYSSSCQNRQAIVSSGIEKPISPRPLYELIPGFGYYKFHNRGKTWSDAKLICEKEGAHLAIVNSPEEADVLMELFSRIPKIHEDWNFIGISDIDKEGSWMTIFDQPLDSTGFTEWNSGEPNSGRGQNCGGFNGKEGKLHDLDCDFKHGFFCELEFQN